jgi:hypothetical protein
LHQARCGEPELLFDTFWLGPCLDRTAMVPAWDGCPPGWADEFCAGGSGFLQACPNDKGERRRPMWPSFQPVLACVGLCLEQQGSLLRLLA